jgi:dihydropteroate synthase
MEYHEAANALERLRHSRPKLGTETTASLLDDFGNPHEGLTAVQVAGSNGKGSTARVLADILREAGADVGLYTSPDLNDLRERVRVRGQKIPKREVATFVDDHWSSIVDHSVRGDEPTFFEVVTALALWYFDREDVDVAVLEVGIGGRYDATSVVDPVASAVTNVSLEHTDIIGATVEEIARDKAQVAPTDAPLVTGAAGTALETIREETAATTVGTDDGDVLANEGEQVSTAISAVSLSGPDWSVQTESPLLGQHQAVNAGIAATLARQVAARTGLDVTDYDIAAGVRSASVAGRFEVMDDSPLVVLDGAHNPAACETLRDTLARFDYDDLHLVFGAMRDKDHAAMCRSLPDAERVHLARPGVDRAQGTDVLAATFDRETTAAVGQSGSVLDAIDRALDSATPTDCVIVTGSLYVVGEARTRWTRIPRVVESTTASRARATLRSADVPAAVRADRDDDYVSRTVRFRARPERAADLTEAMLEIGGTGGVSGVAAADRDAEVVLSGTLAQYRRLLDRLHGWGDDAQHFAAQLADAIGSTEDAIGDYPWGDGTSVMGVLNVTPDSFHDGGAYVDVDDATSRAEEMVAAGADIVDVGGESTRPGADPVAAATERERVVPVVEQLADAEVAVSVDTRKPDVAEAALEAGADVINDVTGLTDARMRRVVADWDVPVVVMHSLSAPVDPGRAHAYDDVVDDVFEALSERLLLAERAGIDRSRVVVDPGLGFGKRAVESFELLDRLGEFRALGTPVLVGHSHKSMFERVGCGPGERSAPTVAATALAAERGADIVRVHDVAENVAAVATAEQTTVAWKHDVADE